MEAAQTRASARGRPRTREEEEEEAVAVAPPAAPARSQSPTLRDLPSMPAPAPVLRFNKQALANALNVPAPVGAVMLSDVLMTARDAGELSTAWRTPNVYQLYGSTWTRTLEDYYSRIAEFLNADREARKNDGPAHAKLDPDVRLALEVHQWMLVKCIHRDWIYPLLRVPVVSGATPIPPQPTEGLRVLVTVFDSFLAGSVSFLVTGQLLIFTDTKPPAEDMVYVVFILLNLANIVYLSRAAGEAVSQLFPGLEIPRPSLDTALKPLKALASDNTLATTGAGLLTVAMGYLGGVPMALLGMLLSLAGGMGWQWAVGGSGAAQQLMMGLVQSQVGRPGAVIAFLSALTGGAAMGNINTLQDLVHVAPSDLGLAPGALDEFLRGLLRLFTFNPVVYPLRQVGAYVRARAYGPDVVGPSRGVTAQQWAVLTVLVFRTMANVRRAGQEAYLRMVGSVPGFSNVPTGLVMTPWANALVDLGRRGGLTPWTMAFLHRGGGGVSTDDWLLLRALMALRAPKHAIVRLFPFLDTDDEEPNATLVLVHVQPPSPTAATAAGEIKLVGEMGTLSVTSKYILDAEDWGGLGDTTVYVAGQQDIVEDRYAFAWIA